MEFALCAVFVIFLLISMVDFARGLWIYHTLAEAARVGTRYAMVKGANYVDPANPSERLGGATLGDVRTVVTRAAIGMVPDQLVMRFESHAQTIECSPANAGSCSGTPLTDYWPPTGEAQPGMDVGVSLYYPYNSMVAMFFPGSKGVQFGRYVLGSKAREKIVN